MGAADDMGHSDNPNPIVLATQEKEKQLRRDEKIKLLKVCLGDLSSAQRALIWLDESQ